MDLHTYKICEVLPRDPEQKMGRPRREILIAWDDLNDGEVEQMRSLQEPRLRPGQIAELDGKIVARGPEPIAAETAGPDDVAAETAGPDDVEDADDQDVGPSPDDPVGVTKHATRMLWDAYRRHAEASAELREQTNALNQRAIAQAKQLDETLSTIQSRQPSAPIIVSMDDLQNVLRIGATMVREFRGGADKEPAK